MAQLAAPQISVNMHSWAAVSSGPGFTAGFTVYSHRKSSSAAGRSLQHDVFEVFLQDGVLDGVKDKTNIFCVYRGGEVVEERLPPVPPLAAERLHQERLEGSRAETP